MYSRPDTAGLGCVRSHVSRGKHGAATQMQPRPARYPWDCRHAPPHPLPLGLPPPLLGTPTIH